MIPRAPKSIRLGDGTEIPLNDAIEWAKSHPRWPEWCKSALKIAECCGQTGLSSEQASRWLLSMGYLMKLWGRAREIAGKIGAGTGRPNYQSEIWEEIKKRLPLRDEILEHIKRARDADAARAKDTAAAKGVVAQAETVSAPVKARRQRHPQVTTAPQARTSDERNETIKATMLAILKDAKKDNLQPPNENDIYRPVNDRLEPQGIHVTRKEIRHLWKDTIFNGYKLEPNQHWKGWDHLKG
jgi:hypothetical protein